MKFLVTSSLNKKEREEIEKKGLFCYEMRESDIGNDIATIEKNVFVNNIGTVITDEEIKFEEKHPNDFKDYVTFVAENDPVNSLEELLNSKEKNAKEIIAKEMSKREDEIKKKNKIKKSRER